MANDPSKWTKADLQQLIADRVRESDKREYKRCDALRHTRAGSRDKIIAEVSKDVSAMSNADGGVIVYGMIEENQIPRQVDLGFDLSDKAEPTLEWLENVILGSIRPAPDGLLVRAIDLDGASMPRVAYLVIVSRSLKGCQANDGRYYRRRNFRRDVLTDWEIRELMSRAVAPQVELTLTNLVVGHGGGHIHQYHLVVELHNRGTIRVRDWKVVVTFPTEFLSKADASLILPERTRVRIEPEPGKSYEALRDVVGNAGQSPLFPAESVLVFNCTWYVNDRLYQLAEDVPIAIRWEVYADDLPPSCDERLLRLLHNF